ncbi:MAG: NAD(P)H-hydrate dehydratase [Muribaculaceae bacterium]|nr:NAD(P)H-hydrate dehydratase [Muribaculaceae bacterium]
MKLFSQEDINNLEELTLAEYGMTKMDMIEAVGKDIADTIMAVHDTSTPIIIFAGPDDCGAYALSAGITLIAHGYKPYAFLFGLNRLTPECETARLHFKDSSRETNLTEVTGTRFSMPELDSGMLVVDALFGSNISGPLARGYQNLVTLINDSGARIIAVDSPSGLPGNPMSGLINSKIIHADLTLTVLMPKLSFFINENIELVGQWKVIGPTPSQASIKRTRNSHFLIEASNISRRLKPRSFDSSKKDYGSTIIFAGSYGMVGAALLATRAAVRSGCGRVICHAPKCAFQIMQSGVPSALYESDKGERAIEKIELTHNYSSVAIGPGIGTSDATLHALENFLKIASANNRPVILDADALNCISIKPTLLDYLPTLSILTPHAGEFDRLFGPQPSSSARLAKAIEVSKIYKVIIVLKGYYTATVRPDGKVFYNSSGTPALATAGSGDVLTGLMAGLMAQGLKPEIASIAAVYIHGIAGRIAEEEHGTYGVCAEDVADNIGRAIKSIMQQ